MNLRDEKNGYTPLVYAVIADRIVRVQTRNFAYLYRKQWTFCWTMEPTSTSPRTRASQSVVAFAEAGLIAANRRWRPQSEASTGKALTWSGICLAEARVRRVCEKSCQP